MSTETCIAIKINFYTNCLCNMRYVDFTSTISAIKRSHIDFVLTFFLLGVYCEAEICL